MNTARRTSIAGAAACLLSSVSVSAALTVNSPMPITHQVFVQPIVVSNDDGSSTANFFGNATQQASIEGLVDQIWAQAGIDVVFNAPTSWNSTFANQGNQLPRPTGDLDTLVANGETAGVTSSDPNVLNMFLVNVVPGFGQGDANFAFGFAYENANGIAQYVGSDLLTFTGGQEAVASVVAHEIGHNLGLSHLVEAENLMQSGGSPFQGERLSAAQIANVLDSDFVAVVPLPAALWMLGGGVVALATVVRRRRSHPGRASGLVSATVQA